LPLFLFASFLKDCFLSSFIFFIDNRAVKTNWRVANKCHPSCRSSVEGISE